MTTEPKLPPFRGVSRTRERAEEIRAYGLQCFDAGRPQWVSVTERMPEPGSEVLVWVVSTPGHPGYAMLDEWYMHREDPIGLGGPTIECGYMWRENDYEEVTHWATIPSPPKA